MGIYGVNFGGKHTYTDWGLIPKIRPVVSPPEVKTLYVDIPGADGAMDLTQALTEDVKYKNRKISFEFTVLEARKRWSNVYSEIMDYLHGQAMQIILDEDPDYYYTGRAKVNSWKSDKKTSTIAIEAEVEPYKLSVTSTTEPWLWDPFNFETGVITDYSEIEFDSANHPNQRFNIIVTGRKWIVPTITVTSTGGVDVKLSIRDRESWKSVTYQSGTPKKDYSVIFDDHTFHGGVHYIDVVTATTGTIKVDFRTGRL